MLVVAFSVVSGACFGHSVAGGALRQAGILHGHGTRGGLFIRSVRGDAAVLRPCAPGELGAVISRYDGVGGYDWVAIPLIPYLYAVEQTEDIPLFVDPKMVAFLARPISAQASGSGRA